MKPTKHKFTSLKQMMGYIPKTIVTRLAKKYNVNKQSRSFSPWSHVVSLVFAQLSHSLSLNDVCDNLKNHSSALLTISGATPPSRNGFSHANRIRNYKMAEELFWETLSHIKSQHPNFGHGKNYVGLPRRFKRIINVVDSTTIQLVANCMDWAKHRRRKAAAKCHMRLDLQTFLPRFAIVKAANSHDSTEAIELCADIRSGEIVVFDKAYIDFTHLNQLDDRGVFWVSRTKDNMAYEIVGQHTAPKGKILSDQRIKLTTKKSQKSYSQEIRLVTALVEINGKEIEMSFMSNNFTWAPSSICDLYKARWSIEVFFKQLKQTLQLADFIGHNENATQWQIWIALLTYLLLRYIAFLSKWKGSFARLFTILRGVIWNAFDIMALLKLYCGTALEKIPRMGVRVEQLYIPGVAK
ncbi:MAG: IS4 family transposase [Candidatus Brocadiaceae bacterium]|nr:IS4 family transposase [Candidatus Brocadiaceae bacterium]MCP5005281.1 IS4 family transposase [Planctomycetota bacterium]